MFYNVLGAKIFQTKYRFFSSLPYSAFRLLLLSRVGGLKTTVVTTGRFKYRGGVMALRAPKHFKAGKQFYSVPKRIITATSTNKTTDKRINNINKIPLGQLYSIAKTVSKDHSINIPLSVIKSKSVNIRFYLKIKYLI